MKVIVFAATKGGVGKSTVAYNVGMFAARSSQVLFADLDPQGSLTELWQRRGELINPRLVKNVTSVAAAVMRLREGGYTHDYLIVDTPGSHVPIIRDAVSSADIVILPTQASALDVLGQEAAFDLVESVGLNRKALILLNRIEGLQRSLPTKSKACLELKPAYPSSGSPSALRTPKQVPRRRRVPRSTRRLLRKFQRSGGPFRES